MPKNDYALLDVKRMAMADRLAIESGIPGITLMENAGSAVVCEIGRRFKPCKTVILCGPGNNGGDGFVVARLLAAQGWKIRVGLLGKRENLKGEAQYHAGLWNGITEALSPAVLEGAELAVVALFGAGLARPIEGAARESLATLGRKNIPVVAVDIPSGIMGDTGEAMGAIRADLTITFFRKKPGHLLQPGRSLCGEVVVADIGIRSSVLESVHPDAYENHPDLWIDQLPRLNAEANKYTRGNALIYGGYPLTGATRLAARSSARAGAGLTTVACSEKAFPIYAAALESILVRPLASWEDFKDMLNGKHYTALLIGPGAGAGNDTEKQVTDILAAAIPAVLDADAISSFVGQKEALRKAICGPCVMTPHEGEFKRVFDYEGNKLSRARAAAKFSKAVIVLKGSDTVIASPGGEAVINANAPATLATAGTGDVLAGIILGFLAQGMDAFTASCAAVWLHGTAASRFGHGLIAEDLPDLLPSTLVELLQQR